MKVLVLGGTGTVGSQVVQELLQRDVEVQALTRDEDKARKLPSGVEGVVGDLLVPETVRSVFKGVDGVFLINGLSPSESHEGLMALNGILDSDVERVVYLSVHHVDRALHLPHFGSKWPIEHALASSDLDYTILRPNNFFQNDVWFKDVMLEHGVYPQPIGGVGLSRVDVRDIAEAAAIALTSDNARRETLNLVGPEALTGERTAEIWSEALNRSVAYGGDDLDAWEEQALQMLPDWLAYDFRKMYAFFQQSGLKATQEDVDRQTGLLGHPPRSFQTYAQEMAEAWTG